jgi:hypothetical protein
VLKAYIVLIQDLNIRIKSYLWIWGRAAVCEKKQKILTLFDEMPQTWDYAFKNAKRLITKILMKNLKNITLLLLLNVFIYVKYVNWFWKYEIGIVWRKQKQRKHDYRM